MDNAEVIFQGINVDERLIDEALPKGGCCSLELVPGNSEHKEEREHSRREKAQGRGMEASSGHPGAPVIWPQVLLLWCDGHWIPSSEAGHLLTPCAIVSWRLSACLLPPRQPPGSSFWVGPAHTTLQVFAYRIPASPAFWG